MVAVPALVQRMRRRRQLFLCIFVLQKGIQATDCSERVAAEFGKHQT